MSVTEDQPPRQGSVGPGQFALHCVLGQDQDGLSAELPGPGEGGGLQETVTHLYTYNIYNIYNIHNIHFYPNI